MVNFRFYVFFFFSDTFSFWQHFLIFSRTRFTIFSYTINLNFHEQNCNLHRHFWRNFHEMVRIISQIYASVLTVGFFMNAEKILVSRVRRDWLASKKKLVRMIEFSVLMMSNKLWRVQRVQTAYCLYTHPHPFLTKKLPSLER